MTRSRTLTRPAVIDAASTLFATRGYRGTSMKDIAGAVGVSAPNLYNHLESKQDALVEIMNTTMDRGLIAMNRALAGVDDVSEQLFKATESIVLQFLRHPHDVTVCGTEIYCLEETNQRVIIEKRRRYTSRIMEIIENGCEQGRFATEVPRVATFVVVEMGNNAKSWFRHSGDLRDIDLAKHYGEFALRIVGDRGSLPQ
ncbi:TetR/AcrR family transcriptional regulator [Rhodococcus sp. ACPA4]|uniref:TetR/AcrR family transcriptional regulator n=1 Tax=Rhodococcus sp. ACPA4 TaxID=2028571 RepID=UPI0015C75985|nr:TetR/AcrR family transcriptional regulator [Rhodococcus sp. ACPA4]